MSKFVKLLFATALMFNISTSNAAFVQTVTNDGNGIVIDDGNGLISISGHAGAGPSLTSYTDTISVAGTYNFTWDYRTSDLGGAIFDPAGYIINGTLFQLSSTGPINFGNLSVSLIAGDVFGWYVNSVDGLGGNGYLGIIEPFFTPAPAAVPLPAAAWLFGSAWFGFFGLRKRQNV